MVQRMILEVPGVVSSYAKTLLNEALGLIYDSQMWSWQLQTAGWLTPGLLFPTGPGISAGTITVTPYQPTIIGDAVSSAAWLGYITGGNLSLFTQLQIRSPYYSLYNIISVNLANPTAIALTLDRPWMEPGGLAMSYMIYQAYLPVPVTDFKRFLSARTRPTITVWITGQRVRRISRSKTRRGRSSTIRTTSCPSSRISGRIARPTGICSMNSCTP